MSWSILVVVGDENGHVGAGIGKARAIPDAIRKGTEAAKKNMHQGPNCRRHDPAQRPRVSRRFGSYAQTGLPRYRCCRAGGAVRVLLEFAGVRDVLAKSLGASNPVNNAWATMEALKLLRTIDDVAKLRGKTADEVRRGSILGAPVSNGIPVTPVVAPAELAAAAPVEAAEV